MSSPCSPCTPLALKTPTGPVRKRPRPFYSIDRLVGKAAVLHVTPERMQTEYHREVVKALKVPVKHTQRILTFTSDMERRNKSATPPHIQQIKQYAQRKYTHQDQLSSISITMPLLRILDAPDVNTYPRASMAALSGPLLVCILCGEVYTYSPHDNMVEQLGNLVTCDDYPDECLSIQWCGDDLIAVGGHQGNIVLYNLKTGLKVFSHHLSSANKLAIIKMQWSAKQKRLYVLSDCGTLSVLYVDADSSLESTHYVPRVKISDFAVHQKTGKLVYIDEELKIYFGQVSSPAKASVDISDKLPIICSIQWCHDDSDQFLVLAGSLFLFHIKADGTSASLLASYHQEKPMGFFTNLAYSGSLYYLVFPDDNFHPVIVVLRFNALQKKFVAQPTLETVLHEATLLTMVYMASGNYLITISNDENMRIYGMDAANKTMKGDKVVDDSPILLGKMKKMSVR